MSPAAPTVPVEVTVRGHVPARVRAYTVRKVTRALDRSHASILRAHVIMAFEPDPARAKPARIEISLDADGVPVRARVAADSLHEAADLVEERLRRRLVQLEERMRTRHRWIGLSSEHEWRHGDLPRQSIPYYPRPAESREVVQRKTVAVEPMTQDEAAYDMDLLDLDFYLFTDLATGADAVIYRRPDGGYGLAEQPVPVLTEAQARERLDVGGERFVFYVESVGGQGRVIYRRYDGHYGLITAE